MSYTQTKKKCPFFYGSVSFDLDMLSAQNKTRMFSECQMHANLKWFDSIFIPTWIDCDEARDYVVPNVLSPRDLVSRPDNMDETVPHTKYDIFMLNCLKERPKTKTTTKYTLSNTS